MLTLPLHYLSCPICMCNAGQFVENLHTQRICANVQRWSKYTLLLLSFQSFRSLTTKEVCSKVSLNK